MHRLTFLHRRCLLAEGAFADLDRLLSAIRTLEPLIRTHADENEKQRRLSPPVATALAEAGIFRMYTPRTLGGFEVAPLTFFQVVEALARIDGSTGWCVFIAGGNPPHRKRLTPAQAGMHLKAPTDKYEAQYSPGCSNLV